MRSLTCVLHECIHERASTGKAEFTHLFVQIMSHFGVQDFNYGPGEVFNRTIVLHFDNFGKPIRQDLWQQQSFQASPEPNGDRNIVRPHALALAEKIADKIVLWPSGVPGGGGPEFVNSNKGTVDRVSVPQLRVSRPNKPNGSAMIIAAGGGYDWLEIDREATPAAAWLTSHGVTAFVLYYRLALRPTDQPSEIWGSWPLAPLQDAQRAVRLVKANAAAYGIDPARIGVLGFSAGGHLMGLTANRANFASYTPTDPADQHGADVVLQALIYPVITMQQLKHDAPVTRTQRAMIGDSPTSDQRTKWSVETYVSGTSPPAFMVQSEKDKKADPEVRLRSHRIL